MRRLIAAAAVTAALAFSAGASAQGYLGTSLGQSDFDLDCTGFTSCDTKDTGWKVFGGYMFTPNFGLEGAYVDFGKATGSVSGVPVIVASDRVSRLVVAPPTVSGSGSLKAAGFGLWGVGAYPIGTGSVFGKLGFASIENKLEVSGSGGGFFVSGAEKTTVTDFAYGIGGQYFFTPNFGARIEWERFQGKIPDDEKFDIDFISAGVIYRF